MRDADGRPPLSWTAWISIILAVVFALDCIDSEYIHSSVRQYLSLSDLAITKGWVWQLVTFQFLHEGFLHLFFNVLMFWWVGRFAEEVMGARRMVTALLLSGVVGGLFQVFLMFLIPRHFGGSVVGASAGVSGLFAIFALLERDVVLRVYGVFPIRAINLLWVLLGISAFFTLVPTVGGGVAHAAHLGGTLAGMAWVRLGWHHDYIALPWEEAVERIQRWFHRPRVRVMPPVQSWEKVSWDPAVKSSKEAKPPKVAAVLEPDEFITREVDPILEKIAAHGIQSLTERERQVLESARSRIAKR